jgi:hypothetical protein
MFDDASTGTAGARVVWWWRVSTAAGVLLAESWSWTTPA